MTAPDVSTSYFGVEIIVGVFGALVTIIQAMGLFILSDIRARVQRLESKAMGIKEE